MTGRAIALVIVVAPGLVPGAHAHTRSHSYSHWRIAGTEAHVEVKISSLDLGAVVESSPSLAAPAALDRWVVSSFAVDTGESPCRPLMGTVARKPSTPGWIRWGWSFECAAPARSLALDGYLFDLVPGHALFLQVQQPDRSATELVLTASHRSVSLAGDRARTRFGELGVRHVLSGWDHLAFLGILMIVATSLRQLLVAATGFTVGHSVSLALAAFDVVSPEAAAVELAIALSIAMLAVEAECVERRSTAGVVLVVGGALLGLAAVTGTITSLTAVGGALAGACYLGLMRRLGRSTVLRLGVTGAFGVVHGFGFSAVLVALAPEGPRLIPLALFNIGVEGGQLLVLAVAWPLLLALRGRAPALTHDVGSGLAMAAAAYWTVQRLI